MLAAASGSAWRGGGARPRLAGGDVACARERARATGGARGPRRARTRGAGGEQAGGGGGVTPARTPAARRRRPARRAECRAGRRAPHGPSRARRGSDRGGRARARSPTASASSGLAAATSVSSSGGSSCCCLSASSVSEVGLVGQAPGDQLVGDHAERVEVRRGAGLLAARLLGGEVGGGAQHRAHLGDARLLGRLGDPEVGELDLALERAQQVAGLDVAVHHPVAVRVVQALARLLDDRGGLLHLDPPLSRRISAHELALDVLHHDEVLVGALVQAGVEHLHDVGVHQPRRRLRLALEARDEGGILGEVLGEQLHRDAALQTQVEGEVHGGHAAVARAGSPGGSGRRSRRRSLFAALPVPRRAISPPWRSARRRRCRDRPRWARACAAVVGCFLARFAARRLPRPCLRCRRLPGRCRLRLPEGGGAGGRRCRFRWWWRCRSGWCWWARSSWFWWGGES